MKAIIAGGREYRFRMMDIHVLDQLRAELPIDEVITGGSAGADLEAELWARQRKIPVRVFRADWKQLGKRAGPYRNSQMIEAIDPKADVLIVFPGGAGTQDITGKAQAHGMRVIRCGDPGPPG